MLCSSRFLKCMFETSDRDLFGCIFTISSCSLIREKSNDTKVLPSVPATLKPNAYLSVT